MYDPDEPLRWSFTVIPNTLIEIQCMDVLGQMFSTLDDDEIRRILQWANGKFTQT